MDNDTVETVPTEDKMDVITMTASPVTSTISTQGSFMYLTSAAPAQQQSLTSVDSPRPVVYLRSSPDQQKILGTITPVLVLANRDNKGGMEANVLLENTPSTFIRLSGQLQNIQAMAQANLIAQTQEHIAKQLGEGQVALQIKDEPSPFVSLENTCQDGEDSGTEKGNKKSAGNVGKIFNFSFNN